MSRFVLLACCWASLTGWGVLSPATAAETRDLILIAGQSNAVGYDAYASEFKAEAADEQVLFWWRCGDPPPDQYDSTSGSQWRRLQAQPRGTPLAKDSGEAGEAVFGLRRQYGNFAKPEGGFGPEIGLARTLAARERRPLAILKGAFSGTGLRTDWNPADPGDGGRCYRALVKEFLLAAATANEESIELRPRALVWVQGESDANAMDAANYSTALAAMLTALRRDLKAPQLVALVSVNPRFGAGKNPHLPKVIEAQRAVAEKDPLTKYVDLEGAETLGPSHTHFTAAGTLEMGKRFATALLDYEAARAKAKPASDSP